MRSLRLIQNEISKEISEKLRLTSREAQIESKFILEYVLKEPYKHHLQDESFQLDENQNLLIREILDQRIQKKPLAYIFNEWDFYGETFYLDEHVLIPRQDTELLIDLAFKKYSRDAHIHICDLGTGSGIIGITLAKHFFNSHVFVSDISEPALHVTQRNIEKFRQKNITAVHSDWYQSLPETSFDLIISNPPYIDINDSNLNNEDLKYEPISALFSGNKGYADIQQIINRAPQYLKKAGCLMLEHGDKQNEIVQSLFHKKKFSIIEQHLDINSKIRVTSGAI